MDTTEMRLRRHRDRGAILKTKPHAHRLYDRRQQGYWTQPRPGQDAESEVKSPTKTAKKPRSDLLRRPGAAAKEKTPTWT
jgi:hypothetical protein